MPSGTQSLKLEELIALNDEMAAISRMGIPLELGLRGLGQELPGSLGVAMDSIEQRMAAGQDLSEAIEQSVDNFPPAYRAIVLAGLESGQLSSVLECVARSARRVHALTSRGCSCPLERPVTFDEPHCGLGGRPNSKKRPFIIALLRQMPSAGFTSPL